MVALHWASILESDEFNPWLCPIAWGWLWKDDILPLRLLPVIEIVAIIVGELFEPGIRTQITRNRVLAVMAVRFHKNVT